MAVNLINKICEAMANNPIYNAIINDDMDNDILIPLKVRDDIGIYSYDEFAQSCQLKQKSYLEEQLRILSADDSDDVFEKMSKVQNVLNRLNTAL